MCVTHHRLPVIEDAGAAWRGKVIGMSCWMLIEREDKVGDREGELS
jgi:hypothetical protein